MQVVEKIKYLRLMIDTDKGMREKYPIGYWMVEKYFGQQESCEVIYDIYRNKKGVVSKINGTNHAIWLWNLVIKCPDGQNRSISDNVWEEC